MSGSRYVEEIEQERFNRRLRAIKGTRESALIRSFRKKMQRGALNHRPDKKSYATFTVNGTLWKPEDEYQLLNKELDRLGVAPHY